MDTPEASAIGSTAITALHDACLAVAAWAKSGAKRHADGPWRAIEDNHRCNRS